MVSFNDQIHDKLQEAFAGDPSVKILRDVKISALASASMRARYAARRRSQLIIGKPSQLPASLSRCAGAPRPV